MRKHRHTWSSWTKCHEQKTWSRKCLDIRNGIIGYSGCKTTQIRKTRPKSGYKVTVSDYFDHYSVDNMLYQ